MKKSSVSAGSLTYLAALAASALVAMAAAPAHAGTPTNGTLTETSGALNYAIAAFSHSNPTPVPQVDNGPECNGTAFPCDSYKLTVNLSQAYVAAHPTDKVKVTLTWTADTSDYDLYAFDGDVATLDGSKPAPYGSATSSDPESLFLPLTAGPTVYTIKTVPYTTTPVDSISAKVELVTGTVASSDPCAGQFGLPSGSATLAPSIAKAFGTLVDGASVDGFVHFRSSVTQAQQNALLKSAGLTVQRDFRKYANAAYVIGPVAGFRALAGSGKVGYIEGNENLRYLGNTGPWASRIRAAQEPVSGGPYLDAGGQRLTGKGTTVCVVDSGVFGAHPDFAGRIKHNYKIPATGAAGTGAVIDVGATDSDTTGGHGTHCSGIAVGSGAQSTAAYSDTAAPLVKGTYAGAAPEAGLVMYGAGEAISILASDTAFEHILENYKPADPDRIRVVSNSWGATGGTAYNPADTTSCLVRAMVNKGISVVFAASNDGGDGTADMTSPTCKDPTPGVICVASYNDLGTGGLNNPLSDFSSRGRTGKPETYPDIAAPGDLITSTCAQPVPGQAVCATGAETKWQPFYGTISGTSMATPQVAGIIALMYQAKPDLTPAQVEQLLQNTARKVGGGYEPDPQNPGGTINVGYGAGLVDVKAVLDALKVPHGTLPVLGGEYTIFDGDTDMAVVDAGADAVKLTMQEVSGTVSGIQYRLTLRDATKVGSGYTYTIESDVDGNPMTTQVALTSTGASALAASAANTSPATSVSVNGNVLSFFVAYNALGRPAVGAPIHNIRTVVTDSNGVAADYAPSPANIPATIAATMPAYGRPFTVQTAATGTAPVSTETPCAVPGVTAATDASGDNTDAGVPGHDVQGVQIAEPYSATAPEKLVFTLKVDPFTLLPPNSIYYVYFNLTDGLQHYVSLDASTPGVTTYSYGHIEPPAVSGGVGQNTDDGTLDADSGYDGAKGTITFVLTKSKVMPLATSPTLTAISGESRLLVGVVGTGLVTRLDASAAGSYVQVGHAYCAPGNTAPVARLVATPTLGTVPFDVSFSGSTSSDADTGDSIASYSFDFGDGSTPLTQSTATATHRYTTAGSYTAKLTVTDSHGKASVTAATASITASPAAANNTAPTARLGATPASGSAPLTVTLDATGSSDPDAGDSIVSYSFTFGDGSAAVTQAGGTVQHTYAGGSYSASVTVTDSHGATAAASTPITAGATQSQVTLTPSPKQGEVPLPVQFDAVATPPAGATVKSYVFYFGDGTDPTTVTTTDTSTSLSHTYTAAGSFDTQVVSNLSDGSAAVSEKQTITATTSVTVTPSDHAVAIMEVTPTSGSVPLTVHFDGSRSFGANGNAVTTYSWDFGDGTQLVSSSPKIDHVYTKVGNFAPTLSVTDSKGNVAPDKASGTVKVVDIGSTASAGDSTASGGRIGGGAVSLPGLLLLALGASLRRRGRKPGR